MTAAHPPPSCRRPAGPTTPARTPAGSSTAMIAAYGSVGEYASVGGRGGGRHDQRVLEANHAGPQHESQHHGDRDGDDRPRLEHLPRGRARQCREPAADPEPARRIERRQPVVGHVVRTGGVGEAGQVLRAELLVDRDAVQVELRRAKRHRQRDDRERGQEHQREGACQHAAAATPEPPAGQQPCQASELADCGQRVQLVRRVVGRPLHPRYRNEGDRPQRPPPRRPPPPSGR